MTRRYLFTTYQDIVHLDFELIDKVCDRMFVLIEDEVDDIPFTLVKRLQRLGKGLKWVVTETADTEENRLHISFLLGKMHKKVPTDIEFAILTDDEAFDPLIAFINQSKRTCLRVKASKGIENLAPHHENGHTGLGLMVPKEPIKVSIQFEDEKGDFIKTEPLKSDSTLQNAAQKVRDRMLRSGNRPSELELLKEYIILNNPNLQPAVADKVISYLHSNKDIEIANTEVHYNF